MIFTIILALVAWGAPILLLLSQRRSAALTSSTIWLSLSSFCLILLLQMMASVQWIEHHDWGALLDVMPSLTKLLSIIAAITILLNAAVLIKSRKSRS